MGSRLAGMVTAVVAATLLMSGCEGTTPEPPGALGAVADAGDGAAPGSDRQAETPGSLATDEPDGAALYDRYCALCHGEDGEGYARETNSPALANQELLTVVDDAYLRTSTALGRPGANGRDRPGTKMSAFAASVGGPLTEREIDLLVAFMRDWQTDPSIELEPTGTVGDASAGAAAYEATCSACHGADGWSALAPSLAGEVFQAIASDAYIRHVILNGRSGSIMPAFKMSEDDIADLIAHIRTLDD